MMKKDSKIFIGVLIILIVCVVYNYGLSGYSIFNQITGMSVKELGDPGFENWIGDTSLSSWSIDRRGLPNEVISKGTETEYVKEGISSVKFDLTGITDSLDAGVLVKQVITEIDKNTDYEFSVYAYEEIDNTADVLFIPGLWNNPYAKCTRGSKDGEGWVKITCKANSKDFDKTIVAFGTKTTEGVVWFDDSNFIISSVPDTSEATCGDGNIDSGEEECDGENLGGESCINLGFDGGTLSCASDCKLDKSACTTTTQVDDCGNDLINLGEECDGGTGCTACICASGYIPTDPVSIDCEEEVQTDEPITEETCSGCLSTVDGGNEVCFKLSARYLGKYCGINAQGSYEMLTQIEEEAECNEDYECRTNLCIGTCVSVEKLQETQREQIGWLRKLVCKLLNPFSKTDCTDNPDSDYCKCIID